MRYFRKLMNVCPSHGRHITVSIPKALADDFKGDMAIIEPLPNGPGIMVRPARVEPIV